MSNLAQWQETMRLVPFIKNRHITDTDSALDAVIHLFALQPHNPGRLRLLYAVIELSKLPKEESNDEEFTRYKPEGAMLYDGRPGSGSIINGGIL